MKLKIGQKVPKFIMEDIWGSEINLNELSSQKVLLTFFRYAECALCNLRISEVMRYQTQMQEQGIHFIAVFESSVDSLQKNVADRHQVKFTIIADPDRELYNLFQVKPSWTNLFRTISFKAIKKVISASKLGFKPGGKVEGAFNQIPADFLIGKSAIIEIAHYGNSVIDHLPLEEILN